MEEQRLKLIEYSKFGPLQKCPYHKSVLVWVFRLGQMVFGVVGLAYLHLWIAALYLSFSIVFTFWAWPVMHCKHCYYNVTAKKQKNGKAVTTLLPIDEWKDSHLNKHVNRGKKLFPPLGFLLWLLPIVLIGISLFWNFSIIALFSLIGFTLMLVVMLLYVKWKVCPTCAFMEECHEAF